MNIKIKNYDWKIVEVEKDESDFQNGKGELILYGQSIYEEQKVKIYKHLTMSRKRETLIHELTHVFFDVYLASYHIKNAFDEEDICCFMASYSEEILKIVDEYFKESSR